MLGDTLRRGTSAISLEIVDGGIMENVHVSNIRKKLEALGNEKEYIKTVWGIGFKMSE